MEKGKKMSKDTLGKIILAVLAAVVIMAVIAAICAGRRGCDCGMSTEGGPALDVRATDTRTERPGADPLAGRNIYFSGLEDTVIRRETAVQLDNREENLDFLLKYEIYDGEGNLVFETDPIPSGQSVEWVPGEKLGVGEHPLRFLQIPYYANGDGEFTVLIRGSCQATLTIAD
ncbi:MAG: hypothetical protein NC432_13260 [Roseburia sp.]|nr:hypothetical protein [Roseburia sp.]MCM1096747.1 hypothetical protein [Ruminococcus flavefaciens]MCM1222773.1 hypothetical protein [Lachnospiraceae bacterium]